MRDMFARARADFQHAALGGQNFTQHLKHRIAIARGGGREQPVPVICSILQRYRLFLAFIARHLVKLSQKIEKGEVMGLRNEPEKAEATESPSALFLSTR